MILRDHAGNMLAAKCCARVGYLEPDAAEALAALEATQFSRSLGKDWVQFVGDAKGVVDVIGARRAISLMQ